MKNAGILLGALCLVLGAWCAMPSRAMAQVTQTEAEAEKALADAQRAIMDARATSLAAAEQHMYRELGGDNELPPYKSLGELRQPAIDRMVEANFTAEQIATALAEIDGYITAGYDLTFTEMDTKADGNSAANGGDTSISNYNFAWWFGWWEYAKSEAALATVNFKEADVKFDTAINQCNDVWYQYSLARDLLLSY